LGLDTSRPRNLSRWARLIGKRSRISGRQNGTLACGRDVQTRNSQHAPENLC
jgi:hypothetical protein